MLENLKIFVEAANQRDEALDHVLLHGPPGLGKTTLSYILANELDARIQVTSGPVLDKPERSGWSADQPERAGHPLCGRDPPAESGH